MDPKEQLYKLEARMDSLDVMVGRISKQLDMVSELITSVKVLATETRSAYNNL